MTYTVAILITYMYSVEKDVDQQILKTPSLINPQICFDHLKEYYTLVSSGTPLQIRSMILPA